MKLRDTRRRPCALPQFIVETQRAGFTRLDLLTSLLMLALLASVSLPRLDATDAVGAGRCLSNQSALVRAFVMYSLDHNGHMPAGGYWPGLPTPLQKGFPKAEALDLVRAKLEQGSLWAYEPRHETYHCPDDLRFERLEVGAGWGFDSYTIAAGMGVGTGAAVSVIPIDRIEYVPEPSLSMVFVEEPESMHGYNSDPWRLDFRIPRWLDLLAMHHTDSTTFAFLDGRVELRKWQDARIVQAGSNAARGDFSGLFSWEGGDMNNPDFRWVVRRYKHKDWGNPRLPAWHLSE